MSRNKSYLTIALFWLVGISVTLFGQERQVECLFETKINDGNVLLECHLMDGKPQDLLIWVHADKTRSEVSIVSGWAIVAAFNKGSELALIQGAGNGMLEYWRFERRGSNWGLAARAALGSDPLLDRVEFLALDSFKFHTKGKSPGTFKVTDEPRSGDRLYRQVLKNGVLHTTPGICIGNELH